MHRGVEENACAVKQGAPPCGSCLITNGQYVDRRGLVATTCRARLQFVKDVSTNTAKRCSVSYWGRCS